MKVAIIKLGALGDIIISTPIIKKLLEEHIDDDLSLLTSSTFAYLFREWSGLTVKHYPRKGFRTSIESIKWLRKQGFKRIYDLQSNDRSRILCLFSGADEKIGNHSHFPYTHHPGNRYTGQNHIFDRHNELLKCVSIAAADAMPWLPISQSTHEHIENWIEEKGLSEKKIVLMHAGASLSHPQKRWPHFLSLAKQLSSSGYNVVWLGADDDVELNRKLSNDIGIDASNLFSVTELIALAQRAQFAVTNDSGPMHVLSCAKIPVYALFGPTNWRRNHAIGQLDNVISLDKPNSAWTASDFQKSNIDNLQLSTAEMVFTLLPIKS